MSRTPYAEPEVITEAWVDVLLGHRELVVAQFEEARSGGIAARDALRDLIEIDGRIARAREKLAEVPTDSTDPQRVVDEIVDTIKGRLWAAPLVEAIYFAAREALGVEELLPTLEDHQ